MRWHLTSDFNYPIPKIIKKGAYFDPFREKWSKLPTEELGETNVSSFF